jgi:hypothetical protein
VTVLKNTFKSLAFYCLIYFNSISTYLPWCGFQIRRYLGTLHKKNGKPRSPTSEGFLDKTQRQQKQQFENLTILSKNGGMECSGALTLSGLRLAGCCHDVLQWQL